MNLVDKIVYYPHIGAKVRFSQYCLIKISCLKVCFICVYMVFNTLGAPRDDFCSWKYLHCWSDAELTPAWQHIELDLEVNVLSGWRNIAVAHSQIINRIVSTRGIHSWWLQLRTLSYFQTENYASLFYKLSAIFLR